MMTTLPSMMVVDVEPRTRLGLLELQDPITCDHLWEPHLWEVGRAYCARCGSLSRWINDPREVP